MKTNLTFIGFVATIHIKFYELFSDDGKTNIEAQLNVIRRYPSFVHEEDRELFLTPFTL